MKTQAAVLTALALTVISATAQAQPDTSSGSTGLFDKKHILSLGWTRQSADSSVGATSEFFDPVVIDLNDLDMGERDLSYFVDYRYRLKPRWSIFAGTYQYSQSAESVTERDLNFDGVEFTLGAEITTKLNIDIYILDVLYTVHRSNNVEVMLGGGIHAFDMGVGFTGSVRIDDQSSEVRRASSTLLAPVPNVRGAATWSLSDKLGISLLAGWLSADVDNYNGDFVYGHLRAHYQISDRFGASLGYQVTDIDITQERSRGELYFDSELDGPSLTVTYSF